VLGPHHWYGGLDAEFGTHRALIGISRLPQRTDGSCEIKVSTIECDRSNHKPQGLDTALHTMEVAQIQVAGCPFLAIGYPLRLEENRC